MAATGVRRKSFTVALIAVLTTVWVTVSTADGCPLDAKEVYVEVEPPITGWFTRIESFHFARTILNTTFTLTLIKKRSGLLKSLEVLEPEISPERIALNYAARDIKVTCPDDIPSCTCRRFEISGLVDYNGVYSLNQPADHSDRDGALYNNAHESNDSSGEFIDKGKVAVPPVGHADALGKQVWTLIEERPTNLPDTGFSWWNDGAEASSGDTENNYNNIYNAVFNYNEQSGNYWSTPQAASFAQPDDPLQDRFAARKIARGNKPMRVSDMMESENVRDSPTRDKSNRNREGRVVGRYKAAEQAKYEAMRSTKQLSSVWSKKKRTEEDYSANIYTLFQEELDSIDLKKPRKSYDQVLRSKQDSLMYFKPLQGKKLIQQTQFTVKKTRAARELQKLFTSMKQREIEQLTHPLKTSKGDGSKSLPKSLHGLPDFEYTGQVSLAKKKTMTRPTSRSSPTSSRRGSRFSASAAPSNDLSLVSPNSSNLDLNTELSNIARGDGAMVGHQDHDGPEHFPLDSSEFIPQFKVHTIKMDEEMETWVLEYDDIPLAMSEQRALCPDQASGDWWHLRHEVENDALDAHSHPSKRIHVTDDGENSFTTEENAGFVDTKNSTEENNDEYDVGSTADTGTTSSIPVQDGTVLVKRRVTVVCLD